MPKSRQTPSTKLPGDAFAPHLRARFWITGENSEDSGGYVGVGRITLLEQIERTGSMNQAAKAMRMSYKKAWKLVDEMNAMFAKPLVEKAHGGKDGGGTLVTEQGRRVMEAYRRLEAELAGFMAEKSARLQQEIHGTTPDSEKEMG
ncbi:MAG: LysR family transcriptional regulator [Hydrogenovibrio sp.]|uniref:winged helix-turn-helix domain-containing protein n=1 Tax=Hydrogenovibrio TaxID=28884 RepID=UPI000370248F|nr:MULTISPECIES: LysR family transcriptional regulator [Hydrogenovibrio]MDR9499009.1 LysR family transcriptional regulator [Hydrogenovibrio sp.]